MQWNGKINVELAIIAVKNKQRLYTARSSYLTIAFAAIGVTNNLTLRFREELSSKRASRLRKNHESYFSFPPPSLSLSSSLYLYLIRFQELEKKNINKIEAERYRILARILMIRMRMARADGCHVCSSSSALLEMEVHLEKSVTS